MLRALGLGDLLTAVPALRSVRAALPSHRLVLATSAWLEPVAQLCDAVDGVLPVEPLGPVPGWPPSVAVNLHGRGPESTARLRSLSPGTLWSYGEADSPPWDEGEHEARRWCRLVSAYGGLTSDPTDLAIRAPDEPPVAGGLTVVHPGGAARSRRWPASRWSAVAEELADRGHDVVVTGTAPEEALCRAVAAGAGLNPDAVQAGRLDVIELCAIVASARLVLCGDTGVGHLATAYGTPSVVLFGPVPPSRWGPPPDRRQHIALWAGRTSDPFAPDPAPGLLTLTVDDVLAAVSSRASPWAASVLQRTEIEGTR